jgi:hypothetical protein
LFNRNGLLLPVRVPKKSKKQNAQQHHSNHGISIHLHIKTKN